jgi:hypothetical protein
MLNNRYFVYTVFITSGILLGVFFCNFSYFTFDKSIKITDLFSLGITSFIGIYIATNVNKVFTRNNSEKELLIGEIKATLKIVNELLETVNNQKLPFNSTIRAFKNINENLILADKLIKSSHCNGIKVDTIRTNLYSLRKLITGISPINDFIILDNTTYKTAQTSTIGLKTKFYNLIFEINKV